MAPTPHENPETTAMRHLRDVSAQPEDAEDHHEYRRGQADLGGATGALSGDGSGDEGHRGAGRPADQDGIATQERGDGRSQDRREEAKLRGQAHQLRQRQPVGERDQRGDGAAQCVPCQVVPAIALKSARPR